jgi:hypothetical protein
MTYRDDAWTARERSVSGHRCAAGKDVEFAHHIDLSGEEVARVVGEDE